MRPATICEVLPTWLLVGLRIVGGAALVAVPVGAVLLAAGQGSEGATVAGLLCVALGAVVLVAFALLLLPWTCRIVVDDTTIRIERALLPTRVVARADVARIVVALVEQPSAKAQDWATRLVLVGHDGRAVARATWSTDPDWWRAAARCDVPIDEPGDIGAIALERDVRGATLWTERLAARLA